MKTKALSILAGVGVPLIAASAADAGFVGIKVLTKQGVTNAGVPIFVCNVFATFNRPGHDRFLAGAGTQNSPLLISVVGGTFFQAPGGGAATPPNTTQVAASQQVQFDSFFSIGAKMFNDPEDPKATGGQPFVQLVLTPGFPTFGTGPISGTNLGWANTPDDANTDPFNPLYINGNGQILIGQFSTTNGTGITGMFRIQIVSNDVATALNISFSHFIPGPGALALLGTAGLVGTRRRRRV